MFPTPSLYRFSQCRKNDYKFGLLERSTSLFVSRSVEIDDVMMEISAFKGPLGLGFLFVVGKKHEGDEKLFQNQRICSMPGS